MFGAGFWWTVRQEGELDFCSECGILGNYRNGRQRFLFFFTVITLPKSEEMKRFGLERLAAVPSAPWWLTAVVQKLLLLNFVIYFVVYSETTELTGARTTRPP